MKLCFQTSELCKSVCMKAKNERKLNELLTTVTTLSLYTTKLPSFQYILEFRVFVLYYTVNTPTSFIPNFIFISLKLETRRKRVKHILSLFLCSDGWNIPHFSHRSTYTAIYALEKTYLQICYLSSFNQQQKNKNQNVIFVSVQQNVILNLNGVCAFHIHKKC